MNAKRFAAIERVCLAALDEPPGRRAAFLDAACAGDAELRAEVDALLACAGADTLLDLPCIRSAVPVVAAGHATPLASGTRLGPYEVLEPLGAGGMGEVYKARDTRLDRTVAIKVLPSDFGSDPERRARFEREARTIATLNHPHICTLHDIGREGDTDFLVMEYLDGETLAQRLARGPLPLAEVLIRGTEIAEALGAAHEQGIVHRDLKPANVMLTAHGVKLLDFGLARVTQTPQETGAKETLSATGVVLGTVPYMAPEQIRGDAMDARTDVFALGIVLYELAAGRRPFEGTTAADLTAAILRDAPVPLSRVRPGLPADLDRIIAVCLEKNPRARHQSAQEVCNDLRRLQQVVASGAPFTPESGVASVAVLPFVNRSRDVDDEYFSEGLADELRNMLTKIRGLRVAARTSSFHFKGWNPTLAEVGEALNVAAVLEGSVRKSGNRVRISVHLANVSDGYHLWSETYDRTLDDIFAVQDDIASSVVEELRRTLLGAHEDSPPLAEVKADVARAALGRGQNPEAHRLYLQARHFLDRRTREDVARGTRYLQEALALDPGHALAWAELAGVYATEAELPVAQGYERAREAVERALSLEPDLPEAHAQLAAIQMLHDWDWRGARTSIRRALQGAPGSGLVLRRAGMLAVIEGRLEEGLQLCRRAIEQDPLCASTYSHFALALHAANRLSEAESACRTALDLAPGRRGTRAGLTILLLEGGRFDEALAEARREPDEAARLGALALSHFAAGHLVRSGEALRELIEKHAEDSACSIGEVHAAHGNVDAAFEWLERAYRQRDGQLIFLKVGPGFRSLYRDPRWDAFLKKMGLAG